MRDKCFVDDKKILCHMDFKSVGVGT
jgi:hypothetical protein